MVDEKKIVADIYVKQKRRCQERINNCTEFLENTQEPIFKCRDKPKLLGQTSQYKSQQKQKTQAQRIRFWGKIFTKSSNYYIIQAVANKKFTQSLIQSDMQKYKQGVNYYSCWVNSSLIKNQWHEIPLINPEHKTTSKLIKYTFSGNLNLEIKSYPKFDGNNCIFLRHNWQESRIIAKYRPKDCMDLQRKTQIKYSLLKTSKCLNSHNSLTYKIGSTPNLTSLTQFYKFIFKLGRGSYWVDPKLSQEQKQQIMNRLIETDPKMERFKGINEDKPVQGKGVQTSWFTKIIGSIQVYSNIGKDEGTTSCYGVITLKNVNWPGWITCSNMNYFDFIYLGYGIKATQPVFFPVGHQSLMVQGQDLDEISQPNPTNPPDELEPDSDDQNKKPEQ